jgi:probable rRNA maturation factor
MPAAEADSLALCLVSDRRMRAYNQTFRGTDATTDVLSFPCDPVPGPATERHLGDIVISVPAAQRQARGARHSLEQELKILALHGYLHLLGHDHETDDGTMTRLERRLVRRLLRPAAKGPAG